MIFTKCDTVLQQSDAVSIRANKGKGWRHAELRVLTSEGDHHRNGRTSYALSLRSAKWSMQIQNESRLALAEVATLWINSADHTGCLECNGAIANVARPGRLLLIAPCVFVAIPDDRVLPECQRCSTLALPSDMAEALRLELSRRLPGAIATGAVA